MSDNNRGKNFFQKLQDQVLEYLNARFQLAYLTFVEKFSRLFAFFLSSLLLFFFFMLFVVFGGIFGGFLVSEWFGSYAIGFGLTALFYLLIFLILWVFKRSLIKGPLTNAIIRILFENFDRDDRHGTGK